MSQSYKDCAPLATYFQALRAAVPELMNIATGRAARPPELDKFAGSFSIAGKKQEKAADEETAVLLQRSPGNSDIEKASAEFESARLLIG